MIKTTLLKPCATLITCLSFTAFAYASPIRPQLDTDVMVELADFVFQGRVLSVEYRKAETQVEAGAQEGPPHTFVTYSIDRIFKGSAEGSTISLRFYGGPVNSDIYTEISGSPLFDAGDEDLLLVKNNTQSICPLVSCADGRFRVIDGMMFNELGQILEYAEDGSLHKGVPVKLPAVAEHQMSPTIHITRYDSELINEEGSMPSIASQSNRTLADVGSFGVHIENAIRQAHTQEVLDAVPAVKSADINQPFNMDYFQLNLQTAQTEYTEKPIGDSGAIERHSEQNPSEQLSALNQKRESGFMIEPNDDQPSVEVSHQMPIATLDKPSPASNNPFIYAFFIALAVGGFVVSKSRRKNLGVKGERI